MAKRKRIRRTPEEQRAYDERSRWIEQELDRRWQALRRSHPELPRDDYDARTHLLEERLRRSGPPFADSG